MRHRMLGQNTNNLMRDEIVNLMNQNMITLGLISIHCQYRHYMRGNKNTHMNHAIQQGPLTTSDHLPIVFTLAPSPIMVPQKEMFSLERADWGGII